MAEGSSKEVPRLLGWLLSRMHPAECFSFLFLFAGGCVSVQRSPESVVVLKKRCVIGVIEKGLEKVSLYAWTK